MLLLLLLSHSYHSNLHCDYTMVTLLLPQPLLLPSHPTTTTVSLLCSYYHNQNHYCYTLTTIPIIAITHHPPPLHILTLPSFHHTPSNTLLPVRTPHSYHCYHHTPTTTRPTTSTTTFPTALPHAERHLHALRRAGRVDVRAVPVRSERPFVPRDRVSPPLESDESETCILYILGVGGGGTGGCWGRRWRKERRG